MTKLEQLIKNLYPNGVGYKKIKDICFIGDKQAITQKDIMESGIYPVINSSREVLGYVDRANNSPDTLVLISHGAYAGYCHYMTQDFFAGALCYPMKSSDDSIITKYIYYVFKNIEDVIRTKYVNRSGVPYINLKGFLNHTIPVPPLKVQREIVRILDNFTELTAEFTARKKQYECYIEILLNANRFSNPQKIKMSQLFSFKNGLNKGKEFFGSGTPIITYTDVYNNRFLKKII